MPKGSKYYSADQVQLVAQANRLMEMERRRQEAGGEAATEAGAVALHFAERELSAIYGYNSGVQKLALSGLEDPAQIQKVLDAAERITGSKMLTAKGRKEAEEKAMASFYDVKRGEVTYEQKQLYRALAKPIKVYSRTHPEGQKINLFDRLKEFAGGYNAGSVKDAIQQMVENNISSEDITRTLREYVSANMTKTAPESIYDYLDTKYPDMEWSR